MPNNKPNKQSAYSPLVNQHACILVWILILNVTLIASPCLAEESTQKVIEIVYPAVEGSFVRGYDPYFISRLNLGMEKSGRKFRITSMPTFMFVESRGEILLAKNQFNLHWLHTTDHRENRLLPIRIPVFKGLIGWRLLFIKSKNQNLFSAVNSLGDLRSFTAGQGHDWPDVNIFKYNKLPITTSASWEGLFKMLQAERVDYFPRSVVEIWREKKLFADMDLHVDNHIALHYPTAYYFFTNKQNPELAEALTEGLDRAIEDGSFDKLFMEFFGDNIKMAELDKRLVIELENPKLKQNSKPAYWYHPHASLDADTPSTP